MADPTSITGLYYWLKSDSGVYQDLAQTNLCTDGTTASFWKDQLVQMSFSNSIADNCPTYHTNQINGYPALRFGRSNSVCLGATHPSFSQPYSVAMVFNPYFIYPSNYNILFEGNSSSPQVVWPNTWTIGGGDGNKIPYIGCGAQVFMTAQIALKSYSMIVTTWNGSNTHVRVDGFPYVTSGSSGTNACVNMRMGSDLLSGGSQPLGVDVAEFMFYSKSLSPSEMVTLETYFTQRYGIMNANAMTTSLDRTATQCVNGAMRGIYLGGLTSINGDSSGKHLQIGVTKSLDEGTPTPPSLKLDIPGMWRFRWAVKPGARKVSVSAKQNSTGSCRPSVVVKANPETGLTNDVSGSAPDGAGWTTIGPINFTATGTGVVWVELRNNTTNAFNKPAYFDHIVTT